MIFVFYIFAATLIYFSWKSFRGGVSYIEYFRRELARPKCGFTPFASVFAPCRGLDDGLEENLEALFRQDYPNWEVVFVVDSENDAALPVIRRVMDRRISGIESRLIVAGNAAGESQKVHNLLAATGAADERSEVFVFVDSDARPGKCWLMNLVSPLADEGIGASTGYRWFIGKKLGLATEIRAAWNASIASALGENRSSNFCWGGSMAVTRRIFERVDMRDRWRGTLSDDFAMTRVMKENGLGIHFVPQALAASIENCTFRECLEFTTRQMKITRVYAPHLWKLSLLGAAMFNIVAIWGLINLFILNLASPHFWLSAASLAIIAAFSIAKSELRRLAVSLVLENHRRDLKRQFWTQNTLWMLTPALFLVNGIAAWLSNEIVWRGIRYRLDSPSKTTVISGKPVD